MLIALPFDCWLSVVKYLDKPSLASISAVSRHFHTSALPLLYQRISFSWDYTPLTFILQLLWTVLQCPDIAFLIQHVAFVSPQKNVAKHNWKTENVKDEAYWKEEVSRFTDVVKFALEVIQKAKFPEDEVPKWSTAIKNGDAYALVTILLSQLHKLESLQLDYSFV